MGTGTVVLEPLVLLRDLTVSVITVNVRKDMCTALDTAREDMAKNTVTAVQKESTATVTIVSVSMDSDRMDTREDVRGIIGSDMDTSGDWSNTVSVLPWCYLDMF